MPEKISSLILLTPSHLRLISEFIPPIIIFDTLRSLITAFPYLNGSSPSSVISTGSEERERGVTCEFAFA